MEPSGNSSMPPLYYKLIWNARRKSPAEFSGFRNRAYKESAYRKGYCQNFLFCAPPVRLLLRIYYP